VKWARHPSNLPSPIKKCRSRRNNLLAGTSRDSLFLDRRQVLAALREHLDIHGLEYNHDAWMDGEQTGGRLWTPSFPVIGPNCLISFFFLGHGTFFLLRALGRRWPRPIIVCYRASLLQMGLLPLGFKAPQSKNFLSAKGNKNSCLMRIMVVNSVQVLCHSQRKLCAHTACVSSCLRTSST
jgi:hypothetical protein